MELIGEWNVFDGQIEARINEGTKLASVKLADKTELDEWIVKYKDWKKDSHHFLQESFKNDAYYAESFRLGTHRSYFVSGQAYSFNKELEDNKKRVLSDVSNLQLFRRLLSVSDLIVNKSDVDLDIRKKYSTDEVLSLLLGKLYDLYDDNLYPVLPILAGNGIELKRHREEFDLVENLEANGLIYSTNTTAIADAQLTLNGKIYVERARSAAFNNYDSISDDQDELRRLIVTLEAKVRDLGLGHEMIFNELQELKFAIGKISKKSWGQLFKAKLGDLAFLQIISEDNARMLYDVVVGEVTRIIET